MATEREIIINAKVRTGNSAEEINKVGDAIDNTSDDIKELGKETVNARKAFTDIANSSKPLEEKLKEIEKVVSSMPRTYRTLSQEIKAYQTIAIQAADNPAVRQEAITRAAQLQDEYEDLSNETKRLANDHKNLAGVMEIGAGIAAGYGAFQSVLALTGSESEELQQSLQKLMAVQTLLNSVNQIKIALEKESSAILLVSNIQRKVQTVATEAQTAAEIKGTVASKAAAVGMRILNVVMSANPAFLLVGAVTALAGAFALLTMDSNKARTSQELLNEASEKAVEAAASEVNALETLTKRLKDNAGDRDAQIDAVKDLQEQYPGLLTNIDAENSSLSDVNKAIKEYTELSQLRAELEALNEIRTEATKAAMQAQTDAVTGNNESWSAWALGLTNADLASKAHIAQQNEIIKKSEEEKKTIDNLTSGIEKQISAKEKQLGIDRKSLEDAEAAKKAAEDAAKKAEDAAKKAAEAREAEAKRLEQERLARNKAEAERVAALLLEIETLESAYLDGKLDREERETNAVRDKYFAIIEAAKAAGQDISLLEQAQAAELQAVRDQIANEQADKRRELQQRENRAALELDILLAEQNSAEMIEAQKALWEFERNEILSNTDLTESERLKVIEEYRQKELEMEKAMAGESKKTQQERINFGLSMAQSSFDTLSSLAETFAGESEASQRRAFNVQKAAGIASALVQTYQSAQSAFASQLIPGDPTSIVRAGIAAGFAVVSGLANVAKIAKTKFEASGGAGGSTGGGGGSSFNFSQGIVDASPQVELFGQANSGSEIFAGGQPQGQSQQNIVVTAQVVETEFTAKQNEAQAVNDFLTL